MKKKAIFKKFFLDIWEILRKPETMILPGQLAFFIILSLVPIITLIGWGASFFDISIESIISFLQINVSQDFLDIVMPIVSGNTLDVRLIIIFLIMFYIASNGPHAIIMTSNTIFSIKPLPWLKRRLKAVVITIIFIILYLFILLVPVLGSTIINAIDYFNLKSILQSVLFVLNTPISWLIIFMFIKIIYMIAPDEPIPSFRLNVGAVFTTVGWVVMTYIYTHWARNLADYDIFYAGLSNIAIIMLWIYFLCVIFVIGMSLNQKVMSEELAKTGSKKKRK